MSDQHFYDRIRNLYRMLFEMATGNLAFRLPHDESGDDLARLIESLSVFAAQFQLAIKKSGYVVPYYTYQNLAQFIFVLDDDKAMMAFSAQVPKLTGHRPDDLFGAGFEALLTTESKALWQEQLSEINSNPAYHECLALHLISSSGKIIPFHCTVSRLLFSGAIFISSISTTLLEYADLNRSAIVSQRPSDAAVIQGLYDYIMANLEKPLPSLKELSQLFLTNEHKLKEGFRLSFNTSIYKFYNEERLKRAHDLIQQTPFPLKSVALMCGFNDYPNFLKAFKKKFGYPPGSLTRDKNG